MTKDQRRSQTKKALLDALVICLKDQDFNDITTIRLVQTAGISRSSFYTHYKDKYEMIDSYQKELFHKLEYIFDKYEGKKESLNFSLVKSSYQLYCLQMVQKKFKIF